MLRGLQPAAPAPLSPPCHCLPHRLAFRECRGTQGMPPLPYFSHSPGITFRKPLLFTSRRGRLQQGCLPAGHRVREKGDLFLGTAPAQGKHCSSQHLHTACGESPPFSLCCLSRFLLVSPSPDAARGSVGRRMRGSNLPGDEGQC